nr:oligosaccharide flippase family protein [Variovorax boronicumulans]
MDRIEAAAARAPQRSRQLSHIALNIASLALPMAVAVAVVPGLIAQLGTERFGALALAWSLVGYFGWLDLGLGRALTHYLAQQETAGMARRQQAAMARRARATMAAIGLGVACVLLAATPWIVGAIDLNADVRGEAPLAWTLLALSVPLMMWSGCSSGALEARSRFVAVTAIRLPAGVLTFSVPWFVAQHTDDLRWVMCGLLLVRLATASGYAWLARAEFVSGHSIPAGRLRPLLQFGGWLTVTNVIGPVLSYFDRFVIAARLSMEDVTHYTVPFDALSRMPMLPIAMMGVLFPLLARAHGESVGTPAASASATPLLAFATRLMLGFWIPGMVLAVLLGPWLLRAWVGAEVAHASLPVWNWLAVGVVANGFAHIPFTLLQSAGRTDLIAKLHLCELVPYGIGLFWALGEWGIVGAAVAWAARVLVDAMALYTIAARLFAPSVGPLRRAAAWALGAAALLVLAGRWAAQYSIGEDGAPPSLPVVLVGASALVAWCAYHVMRLRSRA